MSAPVRVSIERIKEVLAQTAGNLTAAAHFVGMAPNNLSARLRRAEIDVNDFRPTRSDPERPSMVAPRISREAYQRLREASFDLAYARRRETTPAGVLEELLSEALDPWLRSKIAETGGGK